MKVIRARDFQILRELEQLVTEMRWNLRFDEEISETSFGTEVDRVVKDRGFQQSLDQVPCMTLRTNSEEDTEKVTTHFLSSSRFFYLGERELAGQKYEYFELSSYRGELEIQVSTYRGEPGRV